MADETSIMLSQLLGNNNKRVSSVLSFEEWLLQQGVSPSQLSHRDMEFMQRAYQAYASRASAEEDKSYREEIAAKKKGPQMSSTTAEDPDPGEGSLLQKKSKADEEQELKDYKKRLDMFNNVQTVGGGGGGGGFPPIDTIDRSGGKGGNQKQNGPTNRESPGAPWSEDESRDFRSGLADLQKTQNRPAAPISGGNPIPGTGGAGGGMSSQDYMDLIASLLQTYEPAKTPGAGQPAGKFRGFNRGW